MRRLFAALAVMVGAFAAADAPARAETPFVETRSPAGATFWFLPRPDAHETVLLAGFPDAWALDHPDAAATALVGAALLRYGPTGMSAGEFNEELKDVRAHCGVSAAPMATTLSIESHPADFGDAVDLCARLIREPALRAGDLDKIRKAAAAGQLRLMERPQSIAALLMRRLTLGDAPFARWEDPPAIDAVKTTDVDAWWRTVFARGRQTLIVAGAIDAAAAGSLVDRILASLPEGGASASPPPPPLQFPGKTVLLEKSGGETAILLEGGVDLALGEGPVALVGVNVLGGGLDRRLSKAVRGELGATYGISASLGQFTPGQRYISIRSALANDLAPQALARTREVYATWRRDGVADDEDASAREQLASQFDKNAESSSGRAWGLLSLLRGGATAEYEAAYTDNLRKIDAARVNDLLRARAPEQLTTVIVGPSAEGFHADCLIHAVEEISTCK